MSNYLKENLTEAQNELYEWIKNYMRDFRHSPSIRQMMQAMGLKSPAPIQSRLRHLQEKGFISWHNNANASAYNLIFTWSETGDGYFKYIDGYTGDEIVIPDKKGWQCKAGYFGAYNEEPEKLVYHTASTDCWRITVSYIFNREEMSLGLQEDVIEEIKSK